MMMRMLVVDLVLIVLLILGTVAIMIIVIVVISMLFILRWNHLLALYLNVEIDFVLVTAVRVYLLPAIESVPALVIVSLLLYVLVHLDIRFDIHLCTHQYAHCLRCTPCLTLHL